MVTAFFDGACAPNNPGGALGFGCIINEDGKRIMEYAGFVDFNNANSSNVAEYIAFENIIDWLLENGYNDDEIIISGDSKMVVMQMNKRWGIRDGYYVLTAWRCKEKIKEFSNLRVRWIPRDLNQEADALSNKEFLKRGIKLFEKKFGNKKNTIFAASVVKH